MKIWDEANYRYINVEVVWSGRGPLPGIGALERREHYLTAASREHGSGQGDLPSDRSMVGKTDLDGMQVRQVQIRQLRKGQQYFCSTGCGRAVGMNYKRCRRCRDAGVKSKTCSKGVAA